MADQEVEVSVYYEGDRLETYDVALGERQTIEGLPYEMGFEVTAVDISEQTVDIAFYAFDVAMDPETIDRHDRHTFKIAITEDREELVSFKPDW